LLLPSADTFAAVANRYKTSHLLAISGGMVFEERVGVVESLLRKFSAVEMDSFVDFLPYVWEDLAVQYANKLLSKMPPTDRSRVAAQLAAEEKAMAVAQSDEVPYVKVESLAATKLVVSPDPTQLLPSELPSWTGFNPSSKGVTSLELRAVLEIGSQCLSIALGQEVASTRPTRAHRVALPFPRLVFNVLLRRCMPPPKPGQDPLQCAREMLWGFLTAVRSFGRTNTACKLLARLCGAVRYEFNSQRVALALRIFSEMLPPGNEQEVCVDLDSEVWFCMDHLQPEVGKPDLPTLLRSMEIELGGVKVVALIDRLAGLAVSDPRPQPQADKVVYANMVILSILDAFDSARAKLATQLATLHEKLEISRVSDSLDATSFCQALLNFDQSLSRDAAIAIYVDCEAAAVQELSQSPDGAAGCEHGISETTQVANRGGQQAIPRHVFIRVCLEHGIQNAQ
jgi:hypothetical protein